MHNVGVNCPVGVTCSGSKAAVSLKANLSWLLPLYMYSMVKTLHRIIKTQVGFFHRCNAMEKQSPTLPCSSCRCSLDYNVMKAVVHPVTQFAVASRIHVD